MVENIGKHIASNMKGISESAGRCFTKQAMLDVSDGMSDAELKKAAYLSLKKYYTAWGDDLNKLIADHFVTGYRLYFANNTSTSSLSI